VEIEKHVTGVATFTRKTLKLLATFMFIQFCYHSITTEIIPHSYQESLINIVSQLLLLSLSLFLFLDYFYYNKREDL